MVNGGDTSTRAGVEDELDEGVLLVKNTVYNSSHSQLADHNEAHLLTEDARFHNSIDRSAVAYRPGRLSMQPSGSGTTKTL